MLRETVSFGLSLFVLYLALLGALYVFAVHSFGEDGKALFVDWLVWAAKTIFWIALPLSFVVLLGGGGRPAPATEARPAFRQANERRLTQAVHNRLGVPDAEFWRPAESWGASDRSIPR